MKMKIFIFTIAVFLLLMPSTLSAQGDLVFKLFQNPDVPNGSVFTILPKGDTIFVGGLFHFWGPPIGSFGALDLTTGDADLNLLRIRAEQYLSKILPDNNGGFYICGTRFTIFQKDGTSKYINGIVHVNPDGSVDNNFNPPSITAWYKDMALVDSIIFAVGYFTKVGDSSRTHIVALDARTGKVLPWKTDSIDNQINTIAVSDTIIFVGGRFKKVGDSTRNAIAAFSIRTGKLLPWNPNVKYSGWSSPEIKSIAIYNDTIYIGGKFDSVGTYRRLSLAAIDRITGEVKNWAPKATLWGSPARVNVIKIYDSKLFVGGDFEAIDSIPRNQIACFDLTTGQLTNWEPKASFELKLRSSTGSYSPYTIPGYSLGIYDIEIANGTVFAAGDNLTAFSVTGADTIFKYGIIPFDLATGNLSDWAGCAIFGNSSEERKAFRNSFMGAIIYDLQVWGNKLLVASTGYNGSSIMGSLGRQVIERNSLAAIDAKTGKVIRDWKGPEFNLVEVYDKFPQKTLTKFVSALAIDDSTLYVGGIMALKGPHWYTYYCDIQDYPELFVALDIKTGQVKRKWTFDKSEKLLELWGEYNGVKKIIVTQNAIYVAGGLWWVKSSGSKTGLVVIDKSSGNILNWDAKLWGGVRALAIKNDTLFIAGWFTKVLDTIPQPFMAAFSTRLDSVKLLKWQTGPFQVSYDSYNRVISAPADIAIEDTVIYICGSFKTTGDSIRERIASIYTRDGKITGWKPDLSQLSSGYYETIAMTDSVIYFGGKWGVDALSKRTAQKISRRWHSNNSMFAFGVEAVAVNPKYRNVYVGGNFFSTIPFFAVFPYAEDVLTSVDKPSQTVIIDSYKLYQNYPNPFNPSTKIEFEIPNREHVKLIIYDILGREVKRVVDEILPTGRYTVEVDMSGHSSGVYFYRLEAGNFISVKKMILVK